MEIVIPTRTHVQSVVELLRRQLDEHAIALAAAHLASAVDAVFDDAKRGCFFLAMVDGAAIGIAYVSFAWTIEYGGSTARLEELYVLPAFRGRGVGADLLGAALERATSYGCKAIDLEVTAGHERAGRLYARHGFTALPRTRWVRPLS